MRFIWGAGAVVVSLLVSCGGDGGTSKPVDAGSSGRDSAGSDAVADSAVADVLVDGMITGSCTTALSIGELDISRENTTTGYIEWDADVTGTLADGQPIHVYFEFWPPSPIGPGAIDLAAASNSDYQTCRVCVFAIGGTDFAPRYFFQRAGTVNLIEDPLATKNFKATITGLVLEEVNLDDMAHSTPIPTGDCANVPDKTIDEDRVPDAWTCAASAWYEGTTCDCLCNVYDDDCLLPDKPVTGCGTNEACWVDSTPTIVCIPAVSTADNCTAAGNVGTIALNTPVTATTLGADRDYNIGNCTGYNEKGPDLAYKITLTAGTTYTVNLTGLALDVDLGVGLVGPDVTAGDGTVCGAMNPIPAATCVEGYDEGLDGENETFTYTVPTGMGGVYYLIVDSYASFEAGAFTLSIQ